MAKAIIGGVEWDVPAASLRELELAGDALDAIHEMGMQSEALDPKTMKPSMVLKMGRHTMTVIWAALSRTNRNLTLEELVEQVSFDELQDLIPVVIQIQREAGMMGPGEKKPAALPDS